MTNANLIELYRKLRPLQIFSSTSSTSSSLSLITYNLLSQHHINSEVYPYCAAGVLRSAYRRNHLVAELDAYGPFDIGAFQEVSQFEEVWKREWEKDRKRAFYAAKEGGRDGICIVYDSEKYQSIFEENISFAPLMMDLGAVPNIAQILVLKSLDQPFLVILSNTHLFWRPDFDCLRVLQAHRLRGRLEEIKKEQQDNFNVSVLVFMCGDWNSDPGSAVYHLISGQIDKITRLDWQELIEAHSRLFGHPLEFSQRLFSLVLEDFKKWPSLTSAYSLYQSPLDPAVRSEPPYTSINSYVDTLDYIFFDPGRVEVGELLMLPDDEIVRGQTALPNEVYSSDHLALMAKFHLK